MKMLTIVTLKELMNMVADTTGGKLPTAKALRNSDSLILYDIDLGISRLTVYENGYFTYTCGSRTTVQSVHKCKESIWYEYADGHRTLCNIDVFLHEPFPTRLMLEGEMRLEMNQNARHCAHQYSYDNMMADSADLACCDDPLNDVLKTMDNSELYAAISELTEKQRCVVEMCCLNGLTQKETAKRLGISRDAVKARLESALMSLRKNAHLQNIQK